MAPWQRSGRSAYEDHGVDDDGYPDSVWYSLSAYLRYCARTSFDEAFGISYEEAKEAWLDELNKLK